MIQTEKEIKIYLESTGALTKRNTLSCVNVSIFWQY